MYYNDEKIGEVHEINSGKTTYKGNSCYEIIGSSDLEMEVLGQTIAFNMEYNYYIDSNTNIPCFMNIDYTYSKPTIMESIAFDCNATFIDFCRIAASFRNFPAPTSFMPIMPLPALCAFWITGVTFSGVSSIRVPFALIRA